MTQPILVPCLLAVSACARIATDVKIVEIPDGKRHIIRVVNDSRDYDATVRIDGPTLVVGITSKETCEEADVPMLRKVRVTVRTEVPGSFGIASEYLLGIAGVVGGAIAIGKPSRACTSDDPGTMTDPATCSAAGWALVGAGGIVLGVGVYDSLRTVDNQEDLGRHEGPYEADKHACHLGPLARQDVELRLGEGTWKLSSKTSGSGEVRFDLLDAPDHVLPKPGSSGEVMIADHLVPLSVTGTQADELASTLHGDPRSRIWRAAADQARSSCDKTIADASNLTVRADSTDVQIDEARGRWRQAQAACGALWSADHQAQREGAEKAIEDNRVDAVVLAFNADDLDRVEALLTANHELASRLHDDAGILQLLRKIVAEPTRALIRGGKGLADAQHRLCRVRQLFVRIRGADSWNQVKSEVAQNVSELGGGARANIIRLMDAAPCE